MHGIYHASTQIRVHKCGKQKTAVPFPGFQAVAEWKMSSVRELVNINVYTLVPIRRNAPNKHSGLLICLCHVLNKGSGSQD